MLYPDIVHDSKGDLCAGGIIEALPNVPADQPNQCRTTDNELETLYREFLTPLFSSTGLPRLSALMAREFTSNGGSSWKTVETGSIDDSGKVVNEHRSNGFCERGIGPSGRWFNTLDDSFKTQNTFHGTAHPNLYGQLFIASKVYPHAL